jgi:hypothetical protein
MCIMMSLNRWNQRKIYSKILMVEFHVICKKYRLILETNGKFGTVMAHV